MLVASCLSRAKRPSLQRWSTSHWWRISVRPWLCHDRCPMWKNKQHHQTPASADLPACPPQPSSLPEGAQKAFTKAFISTGISADIRTDFMNWCRECPADVRPSLAPTALFFSVLHPPPDGSSSFNCLVFPWSVQMASKHPPPPPPPSGSPPPNAPS